MDRSLENSRRGAINRTTQLQKEKKKVCLVQIKKFPRNLKEKIEEEAKARHCSQSDLIIHLCMKGLGARLVLPKLSQPVVAPPPKPPEPDPIYERFSQVRNLDVDYTR